MKHEFDDIESTASTSTEDGYKAEEDPRSKVFDPSTLPVAKL